MSHSATQPFVSIVIPAYNAAATLAETLDTVVGQSYPNFEVVVVDDGSTDGTGALLRGYAERHSGRFHVVTQANAGLSRARNAGCARARGELIALMDADDLCMPERIAVEVAAFERRGAGCVLASSEFSAFDDAGRRIADAYSTEYYSAIGDVPGGLEAIYPRTDEVVVDGQRIELLAGDVKEHIVYGNFVHPPTVMFRRALLETIGNFDTSLRYTCDWEFIVRAAHVGEIVYVRRPLLDYRVSASQMSSGKNKIARSLEIVRAAEKIWGGAPAERLSSRQRGDMARFCLDAADALATERKWMALSMLTRAVELEGLSATARRTMMKIATPGAMILLQRTLRQRLGLLQKH